MVCFNPALAEQSSNKWISPDGREHCIVQTFKGFTEHYQVSFYLRDSKENWHWNYVAHEDFGWGNATVTFSEGTALIKRNGEPYREINVPNENGDLISEFYPDSDEYCPCAFSVVVVFAFHNQKYEE